MKIWKQINIFLKVDRAEASKPKLKSKTIFLSSYYQLLNSIAAKQFNFTILDI